MKLLQAIKLKTKLKTYELPDTVKDDIQAILNQFIREMLDELDPPIKLTANSDTIGHMFNCDNCTNLIKEREWRSEFVIPFFQQTTIN